jgi:transcriptional regulator with XRE-family HTH domain
MRRSLHLTAAQVARKLDLPRSTVARWLRRRGPGRLAMR